MFNSKRTDGPTTTCSEIVAEPRPPEGERPVSLHLHRLAASVCPCLCIHAGTRMRAYVNYRVRICGRCAVMRRSEECDSWGSASRLRDFVCEKVLAFVSTENVAVRGWKRCSRGIIL